MFLKAHEARITVITRDDGLPQSAQHSEAATLSLLGLRWALKMGRLFQSDYSRNGHL